MKIRVTEQAPLNPRPLGAQVVTPLGAGTVVDYRCPRGSILYVVEVDVPEYAAPEDVLDETLSVGHDPHELHNPSARW